MFFCLALGSGCSPKVAGEPSQNTIPYHEELRQHERHLLEGLRRRGSTSSFPRLDQLFGVDPYRVEYLDQLDRYLILLRNSSQVLLCDADLRILDRSGTPRSPTGWDLLGQQVLFVSGELSSVVHVYDISPARLKRVYSIELQDVASIRDLVFVEDSDTLFLLDDFDRRLVQVQMAPGWRHFDTPSFVQQSFPLGAGPQQILSLGDHLIVNVLLEHHLLVLPMHEGRPDFEQASYVANDGPFWGVSATVQEDRLLIAAGGIENRPLNRLSGEFGYVDSFLYIFALDRDVGRTFRWREDSRNDPQRFQQLNLSKHNVVTPKALSFRRNGSGQLHLWVSGFGGEKLVEFQMDGVYARLNRAWNAIVGMSDFVIRANAASLSAVFVSPLLDCVVKLDLRRGRQLAELELEAYQEIRRCPESHMGEVLFFTTLLTPYNRTEGELSRFTCEACHFEGTMDGRVHFTGRDNIHASTKTVLGLANNVPLFSRGGTEGLATMVLAEFKVTNQDRRDQFVIRRDEHPWLSKLGEIPKALNPLQLRRGFMAFFVNFEHRPNPWRLKNQGLDELAKEGLGVFRDRCEDCHQAIESTREGKSVPFDVWETWLTEENDDLVWGAPFFTKTGMTPYFDISGTRVPSLRRVWKKFPLFANGSSPTVRHALERFRYRGTTTWHHFALGEHEDSMGVKALTPEEISALEALLRYF